MVIDNRNNNNSNNTNTQNRKTTKLVLLIIMSSKTVITMVWYNSSTNSNNNINSDIMLPIHTHMYLYTYLCVCRRTYSQSLAALASRLWLLGLKATMLWAGWSLAPSIARVSGGGCPADAAVTWWLQGRYCRAVLRPKQATAPWHGEGLETVASLLVRLKLQHCGGSE